MGNRKSSTAHPSVPSATELGGTGKEKENALRVENVNPLHHRVRPVGGDRLPTAGHRHRRGRLSAQGRRKPHSQGWTGDRLGASCPELYLGQVLSSAALGGRQRLRRHFV